MAYQDPLDSEDPNVYGPYAYTPTNQLNITAEDVNNDTYTLDKYGITVQGVRDELFGIDLSDPATGQPLPDSLIENQIYLAVSQAEKALDIAVLPRVVNENLDYNSIDWNSYQYMQLSYRPILKLDKVSLTFLSNEVFTFPISWTRTYRLSGQVQIFPNLLLQATGGNLNLSAMSFSSFPMLGVLPIENSSTAPQLIHLSYISGMLPQAKKGIQREWEIHPDLVTIIHKQAAAMIMERIYRLILPPGISSFSTSIDGISQEVQSVQSPELKCA